MQAIASASGYLQSAVASATYNFNTQTPMPQFSPAGGTYTTTQAVTISDSTSGAVIYYTTNGSTPTTSSTKYTGPITVSTNTVINAMATFSGLTNSNVASASYTIQPNGTEINYGSGFSSVAGLTLNGSATNVDDSRLQLTTGLTYQAGSAVLQHPNQHSGVHHGLCVSTIECGRRRIHLYHPKRRPHRHWRGRWKPGIWPEPEHGNNGWHLQECRHKV